MKELIHIEKVGGLKCDNPECDYKDDTIDVSDYKYFINCPCPQCGCNLLTKEDYKSSVRVLRAIKFINLIAKLIPERLIKKEGKPIKGTIHWDGTGCPSISVDEPEV